MFGTCPAKQASRFLKKRSLSSSISEDFKGDLTQKSFFVCIKIQNDRFALLGSVIQNGSLFVAEYNRNQATSADYENNIKFNTLTNWIKSMIDPRLKKTLKHKSTPKADLLFLERPQNDCCRAAKHH